jgi:hypothetical protein
MEGKLEVAINLIKKKIKLQEELTGLSPDLIEGLIKDLRNNRN